MAGFVLVLVLAQQLHGGMIPAWLQNPFQQAIHMPSNRKPLILNA
ncbi:hypothetical protein [Ectothiorhodospira magna]|nr:hypothetical protein [Ectothiorhodospira magna]